MRQAIGQIKYDKDISEFLSDVKANIRSLHRNVMVNFYSQFEAFLAERLGEDKAKGPFIRNLASDARLKSAHALNPKTILLADLSRLIRNKLVHQDSDIPKAPSDAVMAEIYKKFEFPDDPTQREKMARALESWGIDFRSVRDCFDEFIRQVGRRCHSRNKLGPLTHEFFYTLFTFTHLDNLAFEIEEALFDGQAATESIRRSSKRVRNMAMVVPMQARRAAPQRHEGSA